MARIFQLERDRLTKGRVWRTRGNMRLESLIAAGCATVSLTVQGDEKFPVLTVGSETYKKFGRR